MYGAVVIKGSSGRKRMFELGARLEDSTIESGGAHCMGHRIVVHPRDGISHFDGQRSGVERKVFYGHGICLRRPSRACGLRGTLRLGNRRTGPGCGSTPAAPRNGDQYDRGQCTRENQPDLLHRMPPFNSTIRLPLSETMFWHFFRLDSEARFPAVTARYSGCIIPGSPGAGCWLLEGASKLRIC